MHKELVKILQDYKNNNFISETEYTQLRPHGPQQQEFMVFIKSMNTTCLCAPQFQLVAQQHTTLQNSSLKVFKITVARLHLLLKIVQISSGKLTSLNKSRRRNISLI